MLAFENKKWSAKNNITNEPIVMKLAVCESFISHSRILNHSFYTNILVEMLNEKTLRPEDVDDFAKHWPTAYSHTQKLSFDNFLAPTQHTLRLMILNRLADQKIAKAIDGYDYNAPFKYLPSEGAGIIDTGEHFEEWYNELWDIGCHSYNLVQLSNAILDYLSKTRDIDTQMIFVSPERLLRELELDYLPQREAIFSYLFDHPIAQELPAWERAHPAIASGRELLSLTSEHPDTQIFNTALPDGMRVLLMLSEAYRTDATSRDYMNWVKPICYEHSIIPLHQTALGDGMDANIARVLLRQLWYESDNDQNLRKILVKSLDGFVRFHTGTVSTKSAVLSNCNRLQEMVNVDSYTKETSRLLKKRHISSKNPST